METTAHRAIAIVGTGCVLPHAPNVAAFWENIKTGRNCITEVQPDRWDPASYYDPDHSAPDKTYSKIGGWVREFEWDPIKWRLPIPPRVVQGMDGAQQWAIACTRQVLLDYGYPTRPLDLDRTAVILGNAMAGEKHYLTALRVFFPEYAGQLEEISSFAALPESVRHDILHELHDRMNKRLPVVTEDSMPGELANCIAGRIANTFNFHGPNYVCDAACASAMAAITSAIEGLVEGDYDTVLTGGIDRNMGAPTFVKFCKIGALSATGTRPYAQGADGFVMGEGAALFLLKRLADAERDGDKIYAVIRGMGGSSDGKGKGITAPNPVGQKFAVERGWKNAGLSPATATLFEGHGTSTSVGDAVEVQCLLDVLKGSNLPAGSVALGSVKSNIGHLKGAAGGAGLLKLTLALHEKVLPPSINCQHPLPDFDADHCPVRVNTELRPWTMPPDGIRRGGLSAFGFGGTNFHAVLEEYIPHRLNGNGKKSVAVVEPAATTTKETSVKANDGPQGSGSSGSGPSNKAPKTPLRGALVIGAASEAALVERLRAVQKEAQAGNAPAPAAPAESDLRAPERLAIDYVDAADLASKSTNALKAMAANQPAIWKALRAQGIFRGHGPAPKVAFLYTGQGSQYLNMLKPIRQAEPIIADMFAEADRIMTPILGKPLTEFIYVDAKDPQAIAKAEDDLRQTEITQPAVMAIDTAMTRLLGAYGITPDFTMGHSVGEYGALIASGALPFEDALDAVSARGREMANVSWEDKGLMAAVFAPLEEVERTVKSIDGYVVIANINSEHQTVIGGASDAVRKAVETFQKAGYETALLPVSHAFHTSIVAPASAPLRKVLARLRFQSPRIPLVANVNGEFYPTGPDVVPQMLDMLAVQVAAPVQFVKGLRTLYDAGARVFVEVGPKKALQGFAEDVLGPKGDVVSLFTNHPKIGDIASFNQALCGLYAAGLGYGTGAEVHAVTTAAVSTTAAAAPAESPKPVAVPVETPKPVAAVQTPKPVAAPVEIAKPIAVATPITSVPVAAASVASAPTANLAPTKHTPVEDPTVITGAALGLPGTEHVFDDGNVARILRGDQFIQPIPAQFRQAILDKHITRLVKTDNGGPTFETLHDVADVIKLAGRGGAFDLEHEFGVSAERLAALDRVTQLAIAAGLDALRDAGIPLVLRYKTTTKGTKLPDRWMLPEAMRDDTGIVFGSAFPGYDSYADELKRYYVDQGRREQLSTLEKFRVQLAQSNGHSALGVQLDRRIEELRALIEKEPYVFDRRFLFRVLSMGHSQFAEFIGARGPNTAINAACASTTQAVAVAEDWIRAGRCRRVIVVAADDITSDHLIDWFGAGFLVTGAAATDEVVEDAAIPFDRRRHGMLIGMGAAALIVESAEAARERGLQPICEVLSSVTANSAFHGTRLDIHHIGQVMEELISQAETHCGISRREIAPKTVFVSHETYTPARGGSASAEIYALRKVFGDVADQIVIANTKGFTGHAMGAGVEDVVAVKALETGLVPPVANFKEIDPELGQLNLSKGGAYPVEYALHLGAGFGSQISMTLLHWVKTKDGVRPTPNKLGYAYRIADTTAWKAWLSRMSGYSAADLEVVHRTLRVHDQGPAAKVVASAPVATTVPAPAPQAPAPVPVVAAAKPVIAKPVEAKPTPPPATKAEPVKVQVPAPAPTVVPASVAVPAPPPPSQAAKNDDVKARVLALVAEKTGYPVDMLDLDLDLEADLGVDTVKQAEVFATIREAYGIARDDSIKLRDYPTLGHVIRFVYGKRADLTAAAPAATKAAVESKPAVTAPSAPAAAAPAPVAAPQHGAGDAVKERILALVVEKTGYPKDMLDLDLDLDLEADLGVDTVKQAELFAAIRESYGIARDDSIKLRDYPTLNHVIRFVYEKRSDLTSAAPAAPNAAVEAKPTAAAPAASVPAAPAPVAAAQNGDAVKERILSLVVEKTGYPKEMLDLDLDLEADLGVDTVKQAELFAAIRESYGIARDDSIKLRDYPTLNHVIRFVYEKRPDLTGAAAAAQVPAESKPAVPAPATAAPTSLAAAPAAEIPAPVAAAQNGDAVKERILSLVVEKTGYPKEMLDLDLDLEADLGVDTVKQAELFAAIRESYGIARDDSIKLRDYPTLNHVIRFVYEKRSDLAGASPAAPKAAVESKPTAPAPAVPAAAAPAAAPAAAAPQSAAADDVKERLLALVVEKTGYPKDMLDLDLDLEADLGVDTVKQAELFTAIREIYNIPRDENRKLRDYPTLGHVIRFVYEQRPDLTGAAPAAPKAAAESKPIATATAPAASAPAAPAPAAPAPQSAAGDDVKERLLALVVEKTGYPKDMLDLDLDLEADLGVDTVKQAELFTAIREIYNIPRDENRKLRDYPTLGHVIRFVYEQRPDLTGAVPAAVPPVPKVEEEIKPGEPAPVASQAPSVESIKEKVLEIVAEKTGYPKEMLDLDLDLEADLGIDTVKQAEMFAAVRAAYNIPRDENMKLRDFPTLASVIKFAVDRSGSGVSTPVTPAAVDKKTETPAKAPVQTAVPVTRPRPPLASLDAANSIPRRVPVATLRPPLNVCKPTGVVLEQGRRVVVMPDKGGVGEAVAQRLQKTGVEVLRIEGAPDAEALTTCLKNWMAAGPVQGVYWLPALDDEGSLSNLDLNTWHEAVRVRVKLLYTAMRTLYEQVAQPGTFLVSATRLGGQHGYDQAGAVAPLGGAVVGFSKTYKRERMEACVKAVDFEPTRNAAEVAELLVEETLRDPGAVEIGYKGGERWTVGLQEQPAADGQPGLTLDENTVFVITGAAGSIVSAITADLAAASGGIFYLLDLVPAPDPNNPDLKCFVSDREGLKRDLFARIQARGERATPALIEKELAGLERAQAALSAIDAVHAAGGTPHYFSVNLADADGVAKVIDQVRKESGRIDVLLHAAGLERSHPLPNKDPREFDLVFDVKSDGFFNLLHSIGDMPLKATVGFSSVAGRFGNFGQTDYSAANDLLCKITSSFRTTRPDTRGIVIDWTAWGGIGMATRGSIPKMMEQAGIDMLPPEAGVPLIRRELTAGATRGEIVIGKRLGVLLGEWDPTGGLDTTVAEKHLSAHGPMTTKVVSFSVYNGLTIESTPDPVIQGFLHDHKIDGIPVLPGVMGVEAFAEAAQCMLPGWHVEAIEEVNYMSPFKFYRSEPRPVAVEAQIRAQGDGAVADCRLIGRRTLPNQSEPQVTTHFTARVRLSKQAPKVVKVPALGTPEGHIVEAADIYRLYFHGPAYQVIEKAWWDGNRIVGLMATGLPNNHHPSELPTLMAPRLIELCFQTAGVFEMGVQGRMGLPLHIDRVTVVRPDLAGGRLYAVVKPDLAHGSFNADVVDASGNCYVQLTGYRTVALPGAVDTERLKALQMIMSAEEVAMA